MRIQAATFGSLVMLAPPAAAEEVLPPSQAPVTQPMSIDIAETTGLDIEETGYIVREGVVLGDRSRTNCADSIVKADTDDAIQLFAPMMPQSEPASPTKPYIIYAVDHREGGCSFMVMKGNRQVRPLPTPMEGPLRVLPAEGTEE